MFVFTVVSPFRLRVSHHLDHATFPAPSTSHAACGFPALRAPICFMPRLMGPILLGRLSARRVAQGSTEVPSPRQPETTMPLAMALIDALRRSGGTFHPISAALQPGLQSNRDGFRQVKSALARRRRAIPDLWQAIAEALKRFTPSECRNYLAAAGYDAF